MKEGGSLVLGTTVNSRRLAGAALKMMPRSRAFRAVHLLLGNPLTLFGVVVLLLVVTAALWPLGRLPHDPYNTDLALRFIPPAWQTNGHPEYLLGTDALGRDILSMIIHGARYSLAIVTLAVLLSLVVGVTVGLAAGYYGGRADDILMRLVDIQLAFPLMVLIVAVVAVLGPRFVNLVLVLGFAGWAPFARVVRGTVLSLREKEFIEAARAVGVGDLRILIRHLLPNAMTAIVILTTFELARLLLLESALSFLGLGVQPPTPSWGAMIGDGREHLFEAWWSSALPGMAIVLTVLAFNLLGDAVRDVLDPLGRRE